MTKYKIIVAIDQNRGIGYLNKLPWPQNKKDMAYFKKTTIGNGKNAILMGRKTWESIMRPLPGRDNIVISRNMADTKEKIKIYDSIDSAIEDIKENYEEVWIIGGGQIYAEFLNKYPYLICECVITHISGNYDCDTWFPLLEKNWELKYSTYLDDFNKVSIYSRLI